LDEETQKETRKKHDVPDKVIALQQCGALLWLLQQQDPRADFSGQTLEQSLRPSLFPGQENPIVFPFLLEESKSEVAGSSFRKVDQQIALILEEALLIQDRLRKASGKKDKWISGPLVWYFSNKGAHWRVAAGYISDGTNGAKLVSTC
jgi:hypothetical protein